MGDRTPALARATEEVRAQTSTGFLPAVVARAAVSAALHDPEDDVIARTIREHVARSPEWGQSVGCRCGWTPDWTGHASEETWVPWIEQHDRHVADAVRAAILGGQG